MQILRNTWIQTAQYKTLTLNIIYALSSNYEVIYYLYSQPSSTFHQSIYHQLTSLIGVHNYHDHVAYHLVVFLIHGIQFHQLYTTILEATQNRPNCIRKNLYLARLEWQRKAIWTVRDPSHLP